MRKSKYTEEEQQTRQAELKEKQAKRHKAWWEKNKEKFRTYQKAWRAEHKEQAKETSKKYRDTPSGIYCRLRSSGKKEVIISHEDFVRWWGQTPKVCHYCGRAVEKGQGLARRSIDRKNCERGYCLGNMVIACQRCNTMKGNWLTYEQMLDAARRYFCT